SKEPDVDPVIACRGHVCPHVPRPVVIVTERKKCAMRRNQAGVLVYIDVRAIADIVTFMFHEPERVVFPWTAEEMARSLSRVETVGPVERHFHGRNRVCAVEVIK